MSEQKKSWRDVYRIHPAANLFPRPSDDELRQRGEDIKKNGLKDPVVLWCKEASLNANLGSPAEFVVIDGISRLDSMELVGIETVKPLGKEHFIAVPHRLVCEGFNPNYPDNSGINPYSYVISKNIHRRHLTKTEQAELILKALKLEKEEQSNWELANMAKSQDARFHGGFFGGSTKDQLKQEFVERAETEYISPRTAQRVWDKDRGPAFERERPVSPLADFNVKKVIAKILELLEPASELEIGQVINAIRQRFSRRPKKLEEGQSCQ
jgi:hypothetical protein